MRGKRGVRKAVAVAVKSGKRSSASADSGNSSVSAASVGNEVLVKDVPQEVSFWLSDGRIIRNAVELANAARTMPDEVYEYHANQFKNDFADWVRDIIKDEALAYAVRKAANKKGLEEAIRKRLKGRLRIEESKRTILEEPVAKPIISKPVVSSVAESTFPQIAGKKDVAFAQKIMKPEVVRKSVVKEKALVVASKARANLAVSEIPKGASKALISLPKKTVRAVKVSDSVKSVKPVESVKTVKPVVSPADKHNAALKKSSIATKHSTAAKAVKKTAKESDAPIKSGLSPDKKIERSSDPVQSALGKREVELIRKERELNDEEQRLNHAKVDLIKKRYELLKERGALEKEKFERFISKRINGKSVMLQAQQTQSAYQPQTTLQPQAAALDSQPASSVQFSRERVEAMIREVRESISQGNSCIAAEKFLAAQSLLSRTPLEPGEKRILNYDLMELEADIRLEKLKAV